MRLCLPLSIPGKRAYRQSTSVAGRTPVESALSFYVYVRLRDQTQVGRLVWQAPTPTTLGPGPVTLIVNLKSAKLRHVCEDQLRGDPL